MWFEFSAEVTERIEEAEKGNLPIRFYSLAASCYQGIHSCEGDMIVICNAMADYADLLMEYIRQEGAVASEYKKAFYEVHADRCRKISMKLQEQIGYDREQAMDKCRRKAQRKSERDDGVGEEAMVLMVRRAREQAAEQKKGENNG